MVCKVKKSGKKKIHLLMISSSSSLGGGTKHMFSLGKNLGKEFKVFYALPLNCNFSEILNSENHILISERKITFKDIFNLKNFLKKNSIDIIHAHGKGAGVIGRILLFFFNRPLIYTFHGIHLKCHSLIKRLAYIFYEYLLGGLDSRKVLVSQSEKSYAQEKKIFLGNKSIIIRNGVPNMPRKDSQGFKDKFKNQLISKKIKVITLCRFVGQKNIKDILKIANKIPNLDFFIIGNGPLMKEIMNLISQLKISNVFLLGEKKSVFEYLYSSDIYLSTSLYEGLPISILEAMSIGLPIVASNVIGNCDTIENGKSGFLYELKDTDSAANYLIKLSSNNVLRNEMGNAAFFRQRKLFSQDAMITNYKKLYREELT